MTFGPLYAATLVTMFFGYLRPGDTLMLKMKDITPPVSVHDVWAIHPRRYRGPRVMDSPLVAGSWCGPVYASLHRWSKKNMPDYPECNFAPFPFQWLQNAFCLAQNTLGMQDSFVLHQVRFGGRMAEYSFLLHQSVLDRQPYDIQQAVVTAPARLRDFMLRAVRCEIVQDFMEATPTGHADASRCFDPLSFRPAAAHKRDFKIMLSTGANTMASSSGMTSLPTARTRKRRRRHQESNQPWCD